MKIHSLVRMKIFPSLFPVSDRLWKHLSFALVTMILPLSTHASDTQTSARPEINLQELINQAIAEKAPTLNLPEGEFTVLGGADVKNAENLTIRGKNTTLYFSPESEYFTITGGKNVTLRDVVIDSDPLPFTQATVTALAPDFSWMEYKIHEGYPRLEKDTKAGRSGVFVFDPQTRKWRPEVPDIYPSKNEILTPETGRLTFGGPQPGNKLIRVGDLLAFKSHGPNAVRFMSTDGLHLENVTVRSAGLGAFIMRRCDGGIRLESCRIERGPTPPGATEARLISTNADGLNLGYCRQGVQMENCDFAWMGDDAINLHGTIQTIVGVQGDNVLWTAYRGFPEYIIQMKEGDTVNILQKGSFAHMGSAPSRTAERVDPPAEIDKAAREILKASGDTKLYFARIETTQPVKATPGDSLEVPATACPGFVIRNNYFHDHRARGIRIGASEGLIEKNRFERIKSSGVTLGPHAIHNEGGWVHNVIVRENTFDQVCFDDRAFEPGSYNAGAITVQHFLFDGSPYPQENCNIVIEKNTIRNVGGPAIMAISAQGLLIKDNIIESPLKRDTKGVGQKANLQAIGDISINHCKDFKVEGNQILKGDITQAASIVINP
jgi:hypothetical protein